MLLQSLQQKHGENHNMPIISPSAMGAADMAVLERQIARLNWQQHQPSCIVAATTAAAAPLNPNALSINPHTHIFPPSIASLQTSYLCGEQGMIAPDLLSSRTGSVWPCLGDYPIISNCSVSGAELIGDGGGDISRTFSWPPVVGDVETKANAPWTKKDSAATASAMALSTGRSMESATKRKYDELASTQKPEADDPTDKRIKVENTDTLMDAKVDPSPPPPNVSSFTMITDKNDDAKNINCRGHHREASSSGASKEKSSKVAAEPPAKTDYIHVRARRGQATDSHSLAERVRREKISERMRLLQDLVPGCNKITGKAGMLDEIINYVQSLQRQVEFLSMKLAAVTPTLDFDVLDAFLSTKEMIPAPGSGGGGFPAAVGMPSDLLELTFLQLQQQALAAAAACAHDLSVPPPVISSSCNPAEEALCTTTVSAPASAPTDPSFFLGSYTVHTPSTSTSGWDDDLQRFYGTSSVNELLQGTNSTDAASALTFQPLLIHPKCSVDGSASPH